MPPRDVHTLTPRAWENVPFRSVGGSADVTTGRNLRQRGVSLADRVGPASSQGSYRREAGGSEAGRDVKVWGVGAGVAEEGCGRWLGWCGRGREPINAATEEPPEGPSPEDVPDSRPPEL